MKPPADGGHVEAGADAATDAATDAMADADAPLDAACRAPPPCEAVDLDGDGVAAPPCGGDCDDAAPDVHPGLPDPAGDGRDVNCDGVDGEDVDGDGFVARTSGGNDCDDGDATVHPGANDNQGWTTEVIASPLRGGERDGPGPSVPAGQDHVFFVDDSSPGIPSSATPSGPASSTS